MLEDRQIVIKSNDNIHLEAITLAEKLEKAILDKRQIAHTFMQYLENYYEEYTSMPTILYCREIILPLFDD